MNKYLLVGMLALAGTGLAGCGTTDSGSGTYGGAALGEAFGYGVTGGGGFGIVRGGSPSAPAAAASAQ